MASLKERRLLFDEFCRAAADGHKRSVGERTRTAREGFAALLDEIAGAIAWHGPTPHSIGMVPLLQVLNCTVYLCI